MLREVPEISILSSVMSISSGVFDPRGLKLGVFHWQGESLLQQFCTIVQSMMCNVSQKLWCCMAELTSLTTKLWEKLIF